MAQNESENNYVYTFIRTDLSFEQQIVQAAHSALEAGRDLGKPDSESNLILLGVKNQESLLQIAERLKYHEIKYSLFYEPHNNRGYTSLTTEPLMEMEKRRVLSKYSLYKFKPELQLAQGEIK